MKKTKGRDRGASYIDVDFTPIVPTSIVPTSTPVIGDQHEDNFNLADGANLEGWIYSIIQDYLDLNKFEITIVSIFLGIYYYWFIIIGLLKTFLSQSHPWLSYIVSLFK